MPKKNKKRQRPDSLGNLVNQLIKQAKEKAQRQEYSESITMYENALNLVRQEPDRAKKQYAWIWPALAELHVRTGQIDRAQTLYEEHLGYLLHWGRIKKFETAIQTSHSVAGKDLEVNLIAVIQRSSKWGILHQLSYPILEYIFHRAIVEYESHPNQFLSCLIYELLPRIQIELPSIPDSLESRLFQPNGLSRVLEELNKNTSSPIPTSTDLPALDEDERKQNLQAIWMKRIHGTLMYRGANYGVRCAILFLLDMLDDAQGIARIEIEGIEDFDIYYDHRAETFPSLAFPPRAYVQAKSRNPNQPAWSVNQLKNVLNSFAEVHREDPEANFLFLTDFDNFSISLQGILGYPNLWEFDKDHSIRDEILLALKPEFATDERFDLDTFLKRIHFRIFNRDLEYLIIEKLASLTSSPRGVAVRYYEAMFRGIHSLAEADKNGPRTKAFSTPDLKRFLHEVISSVDVSAIEKPLRRGNLELLTFEITNGALPDPDPTYYLGVYAHIRHILANQDLPRPELMEELTVKLVQRNFCVLRSPSGTGKTTLMYRFAYEHRHSFNIYRLRRLEGDPEIIADCIRYIKLLQPSEHSPVLLLIDDISRPEKRGWQELLKPLLENSNIFVIATTREDEWSDFLARGVNVEYVYLSLSEDTARRFHQMLKERNQLHPDYPDWQEAYEASKTNGAALFMEYAHILTKGRRIREVLSEQVERIAHQSAPDGSLQMNLLRLICTAHSFGGRVPAHLLPNLIDVQGEDLHKHLVHLANEHLIAREHQYYIGLHEVRSEALSNLTHQYPPPSLQETLRLLATYLPLHELTPIVEGVCRHLPKAATDILETVALRLNGADEKIGEIAEVLRHLYIASEWHYAQKVKAHLDQFEVHPVEINVFAIELAPAFTSSSGLLEMELFRTEVRQAFASAPTRGLNRFEKQIGPKLDLNVLATKMSVEVDIAAIVYLLNWLREVDPTLVAEVVANISIHHLASLVQGAVSGQRVASLLFHIWRSSPIVYDQLTTELGGQKVTIGKFKMAYPLVAKVKLSHSAGQEGPIVHVYFWAEDPLTEIGTEADAHDKTIFLAGIARRMFPEVTRVRTTGLFATGREFKLGMYDPTTKDMTVENFTVLEDVEKNSIWLRAITSQYTAKTWYAYLQQQDALRVKYITSLNLMARLFQTIQKPQLLFSSSTKGLARLFASYQAMLSQESRNLLMPPDPIAAFMNSQEGRDAYRDPGEEMRELLLQGVYHLSPRKDANADRRFHNYVNAIDRCVRFLCEYIVNGDAQKIRLLKTNAILATYELSQFHCGRLKLQLRQAEHVDLSKVELHLVERVQRAAHYVLDRGYHDLWPVAGRLLASTQLLISRLNAMAQQTSGKESHPGIELAQTLSCELVSSLPSISVLVQLGDRLHSSSPVFTLSEVQGYIQQLNSLTTLDCFTALAQKRWEDSKVTQLVNVENGLRAEGIQINFGPPLLEKDRSGTIHETLPIVVQIFDLMDIVNKAPIIFRRIFPEQFDQQQKFALVVTDGQSIIWPVIWTFAYWDRPRWELAEQIDSSAFLSTCLAQANLIEEYSTHLGLPVAEEPEYIQAIQTIYNMILKVSMKIARLREEARLQLKEIKDIERFSRFEEEVIDVEDDESHDLQTQVNFLLNYPAPPEFQGYHNDVLNFIRALGDQLKYEVDALEQIAVKDNAEVQTLPDMFLDNLANAIDASSSFQAEEKIRIYLSTVSQIPYEDMNIANKFEVIYFVLKNYFHFGRIEY